MHKQGSLVLMEFWLPLVGGAVGAAVINGIFAFYKLRHDTALEHDQWRRGTKLDEYRAYLVAITRFHAAASRMVSGLASGVEGARELDSSYEGLLDAQATFAVVEPIMDGRDPYPVEAAASELLSACITACRNPTEENMDNFRSASLGMLKARGEIVAWARSDLGFLFETKHRQANFEALVQVLDKRKQGST